MPKFIKEQHFEVHKDILRTFKAGSEDLAELTQGFRDKWVRHKRLNVGCLREMQDSNVGKIVGDQRIHKVHM